MPAAAAWINPSVETNEVGTPGVVSLSKIPMPVFALLIGVNQGSTNLRLKFASPRPARSCHYVCMELRKGAEFGLPKVVERSLFRVYTINVCNDFEVPPSPPCV